MELKQVEKNVNRVIYKGFLILNDSFSFCMRMSQKEEAYFQKQRGEAHLSKGKRRRNKSDLRNTLIYSRMVQQVPLVVEDPRKRFNIRSLEKNV